MTLDCTSKTPLRAGLGGNSARGKISKLRRHPLLPGIAYSLAADYGRDGRTPASSLLVRVTVASHVKLEERPEARKKREERREIAA